MSELGCAQDSNGNLLSPSKIKWFNDPDDEDPISTPMPTSQPSSSKPTQPTTLDRYFPPGSSLPVAADKVAGSRRSGRKTCPSKRVADPDNTEVPLFQAVASTSKRKAITGTARGKDAYKVSRQRRIVEDSDGGGNTEVENEGNDDTGSFVNSTEKVDSSEEDSDVDVEAKYAATMALADNDREVSHTVVFFIFLKALIL
jgi:hypothetical protein